MPSGHGRLYAEQPFRVTYARSVQDLNKRASVNKVDSMGYARTARIRDSDPEAIKSAQLRRQIKQALRTEWNLVELSILPRQFKRVLDCLRK